MDAIKEGSVLLVGEGDFSFSVAFSKRVPRNVEVTSSSLLREEELSKLHKNGHSNVQFLREQGIKVLCSVDATQLNEQGFGEFNRIIFNFPHVGGKSNIKKNRELLRNFFSSALQVLAQDGDICVSFCRGQGGTPADQPIRTWHDSWQAVGAAAYQDLVLREIWPFTEETYPEYSSTGFRSMDRNFFTGDASTYVFRKCIPLETTATELQPKPGHVEINGKTYCVKCSYIAEKFGRNLLTSPDHPVSLTAEHFLDSLRKHSSLPVIQCADCSPIIVDNSGSSKCSAYFVTPPICDESASTMSKHDKYVNNTGEISVQNSLYLRRSLLDNFYDKCFTSDLKTGSLYGLMGNVCRVSRCIDFNELPVQHELLLLLPSDNTSEDLHKVKEILSSAISEVISNESRLLITQEFDDSRDWAMDHLEKDQLHTLEIAYKSECLPLMDASNQVSDSGPATVTQPSKCIKLSRHVGFLGTMLHDDQKFIAALLTVDSLTMVKYDIPDARLLWSKDPAFLDQFPGGETPDSTSFKPLSLYPPLWRHDLSFWEPSGKPLCEQSMLDIIRDVAGDALKKVMLRNSWEEPGTGRKSRCYRLVYQSYEHAISHSMAHDFQNFVRSTLTETMQIEIR